MDIIGNYLNSLETFRQQVLEYTKTALENLDDENLTSTFVKNAEKGLVESIKSEQKVAILRQAIMESIGRSQDEKTGYPVPDLFDELVDESIGELEQDSPLEKALEGSQELISFKELVQKYNAPSNDEELVTTQCSVSLIDPISKKKMTNPVRNKKCQHVYDRETITAMITENSKFKCPFMGCQNRVAIRPGDLEDAPDVKRLL